MTKEKLVSLTRYLDNLTSRLQDTTIPAKHINRVESYHNYLKHEIDMVKSKLEAAKLEGNGK